MYVLSPLASISVKFGHKGQTQKTVFFYGESFIRNQLRKNQEHRRFFLRGTVRSCFPGFLLLSDTAFRSPFGHPAAFPAASCIRYSDATVCSHGENYWCSGWFPQVRHLPMVHNSGNEDAARCRRAWHRWRRAEALPRTLQTQVVVVPCLLSMPHAGVVPVPPVPEAPFAGFESVPDSPV